jgi:serine protease Do
MKQYFLKLSGLAAVILMLHVNGFAQDEAEVKPGKMNDNDELIIKRKGDKDSKVMIEIKNGEVFINGKPVEDYDDDNLSVRKKKRGAELFVLPPRSPFRGGGGWSYSGDDFSDSKTAFLGVSSEKDEKEGVEIQEVTKGSAAEKAGLKKGDIITKIDEMKIEDPEKLTETIRKHKPEDKIVVTYKRDGKEQKTTATLGKFSWKYAGSGSNYNFKMPDMNFDFEPHGGVNIWGHNGPKIGIKAQDTEDGKGVKVLDVDDESAAAKAGIKEGDIITQFDGKEINSANQLAEVAQAAKTKSSVKIKLNRGGKIQDAEIKIPKKLRTADL